MPDQPSTLDFGITFDMVAAGTAFGRQLTLSSHQDEDENPPHKHVNDYLCIVLAGGFAELRTNAWHERRAGGFFLHRAGEIHHDRYGPHGAICLSLHLSPDEAPPELLEGACPTAVRLAAEGIAFELAAIRSEELVLASLAAEIMAALAPGGGHRSGACSWIEKLVEAISDQPERRWTLPELAGLVDRHPVHLAQAFREKTGMSVGAFQRRRRLIRLSLALRHERRPLAMLASEFGYCDQSHMNAEFRSAFGISPGRYRKAFH